MLCYFFFSFKELCYISTLAFKGKSTDWTASIQLQPSLLIVKFWLVNVWEKGWGKSPWWKGESERQQLKAHTIRPFQPKGLTTAKDSLFAPLSCMAFYSYVIIVLISYRDWSRAIHWGFATKEATAQTDGVLVSSPLKATLSRMWLELLVLELITNKRTGPVGGGQCALISSILFIQQLPSSTLFSVVNYAPWRLLQQGC